MKQGIEFGAWLKERRRAQGIGHDEFADRIGCSRVTLLKMEAGERRPSRQMALLLAQYLRVPDDEHEAFVAFARSGTVPDSASHAVDAPASEAGKLSPWRTTRLHRTNIPYLLTSTVGRERDEREARAYLLQGRVRMLTLTGPPGIGKTRLAMQLASSVVEHFEDGVYFVDLSPVTDPLEVSAAIARTIGLAPTGSTPVSTALQEYMSGRRVLLLLDNFEHLLDAASEIVKLLEAGPWLKALITSREALNVRGERRFSVPPLATPARGQSYSSSALLSIPSVELFIDRAHSADSEFNLTDENAHDVAAVCAGLDGLPLAIELAAARAADLSMQELREAMATSLRLHTVGGRDLPPRQRTLKSAVEWSYNLLTGDEQALLRSLSVFAGGFTREAAEHICSARGKEQGAPGEQEEPREKREQGEQVAGGERGEQGERGERGKQRGHKGRTERSDALLRSLVDKSLVKRESRGPDAESRFDLLEAIREYALNMLAESQEEDRARLRHARYYFSLAEQAFTNQSGPRQLPLLAEMGADYNNVISALNWLLSKGRRDPELAELAALMASYLFYYWDWRGYFAEGRAWIGQALELGDSVLWHTFASLADSEGTKSSRSSRSNGSNRAPTEVEARLLKIRSRLVNGAGLHDWRLGDNSSAMQLFETALQLVKMLGNRPGMAAVLTNMAILEGEQGHYDRAIETYKRAIEINRELGHKQVAVAINNLGVAYWNSGDVENARAMYRESLDLFKRMDDPGNMVLALDNLGILAQYHEEYDAARRYQEEALAICRTFGHENSLAQVLANMGSRAVAEGDYARAREYYGELLPLLRQQNYFQVIVSCFENIAKLSCKLGRPLEAAVLWGAAEQLRSAKRHPLGTLFITQHHQYVSSAREQCDPQAFQAAWDRGRGMPAHEALLLAAAELSSK